MGEAWPLIGREAEVQRLRAVLREGAHGVVLAGEAGVGKTRLAVECLRWAERYGFVTAQVSATQAAMALPFGAFAPLLPADLRDEQGDARSDNPARLLRCSVAALVERAGQRRLALLVDDGHLLDSASATLVHQLVTTSKAFVIVTMRSNEPAPDPLVGLWKNEMLERHEVAPLTEATVGALLASVLVGPVDSSTTRAFAERSLGNALFLRELVMGALDSGALVERSHTWTLSGSPHPSVRLVELIEARMGGLTPEEPMPGR